MSGQRSPLSDLSLLPFSPLSQKPLVSDDQANERKAKRSNWRMSPRAKLLIAVWLLVAMLITVSGCASSTPVVNSGCEWTKPIYPTAHDADIISDSLVTQILEFNDTRAKICK